MKKNTILLTTLLSMLLALVGCKNPVTEQPGGPNSLKEISSFSFEGLSPAAVGMIEDQKITVILPDGTDVTGLVASFSTTGNSVKIGDDLQVSGVTVNDFSPRITYSVYFDDGSVKDYEVLVYYPPIDITKLKQKIADGDDLTNVNTSEITDMSSLFYDNATFNQDISKWDVSNVTNMKRMFCCAEKFNQEISTWDVSQVVDMSYMFYALFHDTAFNQDLSSWDVSNVKGMDSMFSGCKVFNQDISSWNVSNVIDMDHLFSHCSIFNQDLSSWDVSSVTDMTSMFYQCSSFNGDISSWDVLNVTSMERMFYECNAFNQNISSWNVSNVTSMFKMFYECTAFNQDLSSWSEHVAESISHENFSFGDCPLATENHPYASWNN